MPDFWGLIRVEFGFARGEHRLMPAIVTPGPQQNKSKLLVVCPVPVTVPTLAPRTLGTIPLGIGA